MQASGEFLRSCCKEYRTDWVSRYIQLDDTNLAYLCDPEMRKSAADRHGDVNALPRQYAKLINACIDHRPDDLCIAIHLCRGNYRSTFFASGGQVGLSVEILEVVVAITR